MTASHVVEIIDHAYKENGNGRCGVCGTHEELHVGDRQSVLEEADAIVTVDRMDKYGHPAINLGRVALMWQSTFGWSCDAHDVALAMVLFKYAREVSGRNRENLVD